MYTQGISKIYEIYVHKKYEAAAGPARPRPGAAHGPAPDRAAPGLGRTWQGPGGCRLVSCNDLVHLGYILGVYLGILRYCFFIFSFKPTTRKNYPLDLPGNNPGTYHTMAFLITRKCSIQL